MQIPTAGRIGAGGLLCEHCTAACCRYIALPIDKPRTARDYDDIRWYLMHEGVSVFVEDGDWYIQFRARCRNLSSENRCGIYETRPEICREYQPGDCEYSSAAYAYEHLFTHPKEVEELYLRKTGKSLGAPGGGGSNHRPRRKRRKSRA